MSVCPAQLSASMDGTSMFDGGMDETISEEGSTGVLAGCTSEQETSGTEPFSSGQDTGGTGTGTGEALSLLRSFWLECRHTGRVYRGQS